MDDTDETLTSRQKTHGLWRQTAGCCHAIKEAMNIWRTANLSATQKETMDQLAVKMARICCGDPNEPDHWDDISGYGRNEANECRRAEPNQTSEINQTFDIPYQTSDIPYITSKGVRGVGGSGGGELRVTPGELAANHHLRDAFRDAAIMSNPYDEYLKDAPEDNPPARLPVPLPDPATMPEEFSRSTMLALRTQQEILELQLNPADEHYEAELRAKTAMAGTQINAQLKSDEQRLKRQIAQVSFYDELRRALEEFRARRIPMDEWKYGNPPENKIGIEYRFSDGYGHIFICDSPRAFKTQAIKGDFNVASRCFKKQELTLIAWRHKGTINGD